MTPSIQIQGKTYRGALHAHTTCSDGHCSPKELRDRYRDLGYDFVFITDHNRWNDHSDLSRKDIKVFSAQEMTCKGGEHVVALGVHQALVSKRPIQTMIDEINTLGGVPMLCHPHWSRLSLKAALKLKNYPLMEIWNGGCERELTADDSRFWEQILATGRHVFGTAVDDCHLKVDMGLGWVEVRAARLDEPSILAALRSGNFYATNGPMIKKAEITPEKARIAGKKLMRTVGLFGDGGPLTTHTISPGRKAKLDHCKLKPHRTAKIYMRLEMEDGKGRRAWTQPLFLEKQVMPK